MTGTEDPRPRCDNCGKPTSLGLEFSGGRKVPMCVDCQEKYRRTEDIGIQRQLRWLNFNRDNLEHTVGFPIGLPRYEFPEPPTVNHININRSNIGVLNTGTIGHINTAIGRMQSAGSEQLATAFQQLIQQVLDAPDATAEQKKELVESLSVLAEEAAQPPEKRRKVVMSAILKNMQTGLTIIQSLKPVYDQWLPVIQHAFQSLPG
jgi:hypothetical protein